MKQCGLRIAEKIWLKYGRRADNLLGFLGVTQLVFQKWTTRDQHFVAFLTNQLYDAMLL